MEFSRQESWSGLPFIPFCRGTSLTQGRNLGLLHCRWILYCLSHQGSLIMVPSSYGTSQKGTHATFWTAASPKSSWQMSSAAGRINSSPTVKGLALAIGLATKNDVFCSDTFNEVVAFNNCFCSSVHFFFFFWKTPKACLLTQGAWSLCGKAVSKASWLCWIASCPHYTAQSEECVSPFYSELVN